MSTTNLSASTFAGQQLHDAARCPRALRTRQGPARRRVATCSATPDKLVELFTLAVKTANGPAGGPPGGALDPSPSVPAFNPGSISVPSLPSPGNAQAAVDSAVSGAIDLIKGAGNLAKSGVDSAAVGAGYAKQAYDKVSPALSDAARTATPIVKSAAKTAGDIAGPIIQSVKPVVSGAVGQVESFLSAQGLNSQAIVGTAKEAQGKAEGVYNTAQPQIQPAVRFLQTSSPTQLAEYALGLVAFYYLGPPVLRLFFGGLRGYRGEISPAAALDTASREGNCLIVDIRSQREKESAGVPDLPFGGRLVECEYASVGDRRLRGQLRNVGDIERKVTVLEIASLKRVGKGTKILLLDSNGGTSKRIARDLGGRGFRNVFVVAGGFGGWTGQKLQTKGSSTVSSPEILSPFFGGTQRQTQPSGRRALPSGR
ncbi:hypothetical protein WJX73_002375 [Symbiochloris irregularis]|uniref:Rhodanese domain-containing protein n=1 Tax=Symbiochloris irregularis TaxID=706552 RepID=A0AAW1NWT4_9CHLO